MIISLGRQYIFVHIPKTGGTALSLALEARAMKDDILIGDTPKAKRRKRKIDLSKARGRVWKHSTLADIDGLLDADVLSGLFAFTLVRNPWDRMVSYYHWLQDQSFVHPAVALAQSLSFADFVRHPVTAKALRAAPASHYMQRADGSQQKATYIRLEHFAKDAEPLFDHLGFRLDLPRVNTSVRSDNWKDYYDGALADAVAENCKMDIERFGYTFNDVTAVDVSAKG